jgi:cyclase
MIDTPMRPSDAIEWQQEMIKKGEIKYLINTDQHPDHFLINKFFPGKIIAHNATREAIINWPKEKVIEFVNRADPEAS